MFGKSLVFVFLALFALQGCANARYTSYALQEREARNAIDSVIDTIKSAIDSAVAYVKNLVNDVINEAEGVINSVTAEYDKIVESAKGTIDKVIQEANKLGINVQDCVDDKKAFEKLKESLISNLKALVKQKVNEVYTLIDSIENIYLKVKDDFKALYDQLAECGTFDFKCYYDIGDKAIQLGGSVKDEIFAVKDQILDMIDKIKYELPLDLLKVGDKIKDEALNIADEIVSCVKDKISGQKSLTPEDRAISDIVNKIKKIVDGVKQYIEKAIAKVGDVVAYIVKRAKEVAGELLDLAHEEYNKLVASLENTIKEWIEKAKQAEIDVTECIRSEQEQFANLKNKLEEGFKKAIADKVAEAQEKAQAAHEVFEDYKAQFLALEKRLSECDGFTCYLGVFNDGLSLAGSAKGKVSEVLADVLELIASVEKDLPGRLYELKDVIFADAQVIKNEIVECIKNKVENN